MPRSSPCSPPSSCRRDQPSHGPGGAQQHQWVDGVGPDKIKLIGFKERITVSYQDEVAVAYRQ